MVFPEVVQRAAPTDTPEIVSTLQLPDPTVDVGTLFHELAHGFDVFLGPGNARDYAPTCQLGSLGCDEDCDEDTTDEAWPLDETVAQMVSLWMVRRAFPELPHAQCDLLDEYAVSTDNQRPVHSPECLDADDELNVWLRDDDPACPDTTLCDKPYRQAAPGDGAPNNCRTTDGYNTFSILQAWWNTLNGMYCEPTAPFVCIDYAPQWPPGCGVGGGAPQCVTADEAAGLALVYALRTNALSYVEFFDGMSRFVACNYGNDAYLVFNTALCDHGIRPCNAPLPLVCETCGNGIREGGEKCDGLDLTVDEVGIVPQCTDFGYVGGELSCDAMCELDFSDCESPPVDTSAGEGEVDGGEDVGGNDDAADDASSGGDGGQVGEDGCACTSGPGGRPGAGWLALALLGLRRRRLAAAALAMGASACGPKGGSSNTDTAVSTSSSSASSGSVEGWPERWYGQYYEATYVDLNYEEVEIELGVEIPSNDAGHYFYNVRLEPGVVRLDYFDSTGREDRKGTSIFTPEIDSDGLVILPDEGEDSIEGWPLGGVRQEIRPGSDCSELEREATFTAMVEPHETTLVTTLRRGRLCLVVPAYLDTTSVPPAYKVVVDLCTDDPAPTTCDPT